MSPKSPGRDGCRSGYATHSERCTACPDGKDCSRDGRHHRTRVVLALPVTPEGIPCGNGPHPGNTCEGHTLIDALDLPSDEYLNARFTVVADAGMPSADNRERLEKRRIPTFSVPGPGARPPPE